MIDTITNVQNKLFPHVFIKKFFILKNAAALRTLFFETCNCARFRAISCVIKKFFILKNTTALRTLFFETCNCAQFRAISYVINKQRQRYP